jgi:excisionase family DNA binding protein
MEANNNKEKLVVHFIEFDRPKDECLTVSVVEAARMLGVSPQTIYNAIKNGVITAIRISAKRLRISKIEIQRVLKGGIL